MPSPVLARNLHRRLLSGGQISGVLPTDKPNDVITINDYARSCSHANFDVDHEFAIRKTNASSLKIFRTSGVRADNASAVRPIHCHPKARPDNNSAPGSCAEMIIVLSWCEMLRGCIGSIMGQSELEGRYGGTVNALQKWMSVPGTVVLHGDGGTVNDRDRRLDGVLCEGQEDIAVRCYGCKLRNMVSELVASRMRGSDNTVEIEVACVYTSFCMVELETGE